MTKTLYFLRVIRLDWLAKIEFRWARRPWSSILWLVTIVNEKCKKETETEETIGFFVTFLSLVKFQLGGRAPCPSPFGYAYAPSSDGVKYSTSVYEYRKKLRVRVLILKNVLEYEYRKKVRVRVLLQV